MQSTNNINVKQITPLTPPDEIKEELPLSEKACQTVVQARQTVRNILDREDHRLFAVVGPCSIHDTEVAIEYALRLKALHEEFKDRIYLIMRVYFEKPRTTVGWKGFINDPGLDESCDINRGLRLARELLLNLADMQVSAGTEFLDTISPQYVADLVTWGAIGARTTESQVHRELSSGLSMPVGFKNGTDGNIKIAIDAICAAQNPHCFLSVTKQGVSAIVRTKGNDSCHVILRGSSKVTNYDADSIKTITNELAEAGLDTGVMVDCSHGNSLKDHRNQPGVIDALAEQLRAGESNIRGVMIESHLEEGNQKVIAGQDLVYGQSITDKCIAWNTTETVLQTLADASAARMKG